MSEQTTNLQERLGVLFGRPSKRGVVADVARLCKKSTPSVHAWFKNPKKVQTIPLECAEKICAMYAPDVSPVWLSEGRGNYKAGVSIGQPGEIQKLSGTGDVLIPEFNKALNMVLDALAASPDRSELRQLLPMLVDTNAPAYRQRLAELLAQPAAHPMPAAESRDFQPPVPSVFDKTKQPT